MPKPHFVFETAQLGPEVLHVRDYVGKEAISRLYQFELNLFSRDRTIDFADVVSRPATLTLRRGEVSMPIHGLVADFEQGGETADYVAYRALLLPRIWILTLTYQSRIFQRKTVEEIITEVLQGAGFGGSDYRFALTAEYETREYCVQYQETDWDFICRLMEHEGIFFFFEQGDEHETIVVTDDRSHFTAIAGENTVGYHPESGALTTGEEAEAPEVVDAFTCREHLVTGRVLLNDYNYRTPDVDLKVEARANGEGEAEGVYYEYGAHYKTPSQGDRLAQVRREEIACTRRLTTGRSNCMAFRCGQVFTLQEHYRNDRNGAYLLTRVTHIGTQGTGLTASAGTETTYRNEFTCIPAEAPYRPTRSTPVPRIPGIMTARIESSGGDYPYIDDQGRYRARMHFDRGEAETADATRPLRMSQPHSGPDYGIHFPHHADTEVVWACVNGDVDRPLALGTAPNPDNTSPSLEGNNYENVVRTKAGNQMIMDDRIDEEQIRINTPAANTMLLDDKDDRIVITTTNNHIVTLDDKNSLIMVQTSGGHFLLMDDANKKVTLQSTDGHRLSIDDPGQKMVMSDASGDNFFQIDMGSQKLTIKSENGDIDVLAPNGHINIEAQTMHLGTTGDTTQNAENIRSSVRNDHSIKAASKINIDASTAIDIGYTTSPDDLHVWGTKTEIIGTQEATVMSFDELWLSGFDTVLDGMTVGVYSDGPNKITGLPVRINCAGDGAPESGGSGSGSDSSDEPESSDAASASSSEAAPEVASVSEGGSGSGQGSEQGQESSSGSSDVDTGGTQTLELGEAERIDTEGEGTQTLELGEAERIDTEGEGTQTLELGEAERIDTEGEGTQTLELGEAERIDTEGEGTQDQNSGGYTPLAPGGQTTTD